MYILKNNTHAEAGCILSGEKAKGFSVPTSYGSFTESEIDLSNLSISGNILSFDIIKWQIPNIRSYADAKKFVVGKRYSNDDQIAIMLNKDESDEGKLAYNKMQEWREWASVVAHKIMDCINSKNNGNQSAESESLA